MRDNNSMAHDLIALFLLAGASGVVTIAAGASGVVTIATVMYAGFPRPETRFTLVVTLLLVYVLFTLALLWFLSPFIDEQRGPHRHSWLYCNTYASANP